MEKQRGLGVLCHISSLPNEYGIGSLGKEAYEFVDLLKKAHVKYWQILPLQQTGYGDSPYQSVCCTSGNPYFIDIEALKSQGLLDDEELEGAKVPEGDVDYAELYEKRYALLRRAYARFNIRSEKFVEFIESGEFEDYALFMSLKARYGGTFNHFPDAYKYKEHLAVYEFRNAVYRSEYCFWLFLQYEFKLQWQALKSYANQNGIKIIGDIPLYVAYDSSDIWARSELFQLDEDLKPVKVAGVPPDYFSKHGQLWGNPLYNWDAVRAENYDWWIDRIAKAKEMYDVIRIDHFRGFDRYYAIPAGAHNATVGEWEDGPGIEFFKEVEKRLGKTEIIAEDLGILDDGVTALRDDCKFPGMNVLMFAFDGDGDNAYLPANMVENSVTYTGTHDNDTALGFLERMTEAQFKDFKKQLRKTLKEQDAYMPVVDRQDAAKALCRSAAFSKSYLTVLPVQDILCLDNAARMNVPSTSVGNWRFRLSKMLARNAMAELKKLIKDSDRG
ncbi:MAG: 4-alpha-glucanotransferase [Clostridiales bacterium]|nr:4-alpha-glucanotransferase [Clostridiales bacterium]